MRDRGTFQWKLAPELYGRPCPFVLLEGKLAKRVAGLSLIREDLGEVRAILRRARDANDDLAGNKAFLFGILSLYGKCFTQAKGRGVNLDPKTVFKSSDFKDRHYRLMRMRNEFVAHGGDAREEHLKLMLLLEPDENNRAARGIVGQGVSADGLDAQACDECLEIVDEALAYVENALKKANVKLARDVANKGVDWAYENAIWPDT